MIPGRYPIGTHWVSQGGKNDPRCFKKWNACLCWHSIWRNAHRSCTLFKGICKYTTQNEHVFMFSETPPNCFPIFFQWYPVVISLIFMEKKKKKKTSEQICTAYTYLYIWSTQDSQSTHKELYTQRCTIQTSVFFSKILSVNRRVTIELKCIQDAVCSTWPNKVYRIIISFKHSISKSSKTFFIFLHIFFKIWEK